MSNKEQRPLPELAAPLEEDSDRVERQLRYLFCISNPLNLF
jgi:hypothetical protein